MKGPIKVFRKKQLLWDKSAMHVIGYIKHKKQTFQPIKQGFTEWLNDLNLQQQ